MRELTIVCDGAVAVRDGSIIGVGRTKDIIGPFKGGCIICSQGKTVIPGFVDPNNHLVSFRFWEDEFEMQVEGVSNLDLIRSGGAL